MKPSDLLLSLLPTTSGLTELAHWLDAEGATSQLSVFISYTSAVGAAEAIVDAIHSEAATAILVDRLCVLRPHRADEIRRDLTFAAIKREQVGEDDELLPPRLVASMLDAAQARMKWRKMRRNIHELLAEVKAGSYKGDANIEERLAALLED